MTNETKVGFIGIGMMGLPMAENLASRPGVRVLAYDASPERLALLHTHAAWATSLKGATTLDALAACDVVITMLPNSSITNAVIAGTSSGANDSARSAAPSSSTGPSGSNSPGARGLVSILRRGAVIVDMGSSNPMETRALAALLAEAGIALLDAPVSGSVAKARTGTLTIMVGGEDAAYATAQPVLAAMGSTLLRTGAVGSAHAMKALNNYVYAAGLMAVSEALTIARGMELDLDVFADVLNTSSGRNIATETKLRQFLLPRDFAGGFGLRLQAKDLATARSLQQALGLSAPQLELCERLWQQATGELAPTADNTEILRFVEKRQTAG